MKIAILGATSQIAKDLVQSFSQHNGHDLALFARRPDVVRKWLDVNGLGGRYATSGFEEFKTSKQFDAVINFVGVGNPAQASAMGASILDITLEYDELALAYIKAHPHTKYIYLSSGAAYGGGFKQPVDSNSHAVIPLNNFQPQDWYGLAKLYAECRHRAQSHLPIVDIRVFNYFSHTQDMSARFFITDIARAIQEKVAFQTSSYNIVRDFIHPSDFYNLVNCILSTSFLNISVDCYSKDPIAKIDLLKNMEEKFSLRYKLIDSVTGVNATGNKINYYSKNKVAGTIGFLPSFSSLDSVIDEMAKFIKSSHH